MRTGTISGAIVVLVTLFSISSIDVSQNENGIVSERTGPPHDCDGNENLSCGGRVFYITPVHHVSSYQDPNIAEMMRNAVRYVSPYTIDPINVLVFTNANDRAQAIFDSLLGQPDISPVKTTNQNDLLSLSSYDVVVVHSNGVDFSVSVEQSIADFAGNGGGVIGGHDVIWAQFNNPVLYELFGAVAFGDGGNPGIGWFKGDITVLKAINHPITAGIPDSWDLIDEEYYFDVQFKLPMLVVLKTNHSGSLIPVAWTLSLPQIEAPTDISAEVWGDDIRLEWNNPNASRVAYHLVYRAESTRTFDFTNPHHDTSGDPVPTREDWTDQGAATPTAPRDYYYIVRAVNAYGMKSPTSQTVGKWTRYFDQGLNSFSLPLKPFAQTAVSQLANDISSVESLDWLNDEGNWVRYDPRNPNLSNDTISGMGVTYQLILTTQTDHTFVGYPGIMIRFMERLGNSTSYLESLTLDVQGNSVVLDWTSTAGAIRYHVYRSTSREGLLDMSQGPVLITTMTSFVDANILNGFSGELFYAIVAEDDYCGIGSSTYSKGLVKKVFNQGIESFALDIVPLQQNTLDWYSSQIWGIEGFAYVTNSTWKFHANRMPPGVYDAVVDMSFGYQISVVETSTTFVYIGE